MRREFKDLLQGFCGAVGLIVLYALVIFGDPDTITTLCGETKSCFRDWVSALSGWIAAFLAGITILFLHRQIVVAERYNKAAIVMQIRPKYVLFLNVSALARARYTHVEEVAQKLGESTVEDVPRFIIKLRNLIADLERSDVLSASSESGLIVQNPSVIAKSFEGAADILDGRTEIPDDLHKQWKRAAIIALNLDIRYFRSLEQNCLENLAYLQKFLAASTTEAARI